jgi:hypothetical protein
VTLPAVYGRAGGELIASERGWFNPCHLAGKSVVILNLGRVNIDAVASVVGVAIDKRHRDTAILRERGIGGVESARVPFAGIPFRFNLRKSQCRLRWLMVGRGTLDTAVERVRPLAAVAQGASRLRSLVVVSHDQV